MVGARPEVYPEWMSAEASGTPDAASGSHDDLLRSEARYRALVEQVPGIVYIDTDEAGPRPDVRQPAGVRADGLHRRRMDGRPRTRNQRDPPGRPGARSGRVALRGQQTGAVLGGIPVRACRRPCVVVPRHRAVGVPPRTANPSSGRGLSRTSPAANRTEDMVAESELRHHALVEQVPAIVFMDSHEESPVCFYVSPQSTAMFGYSPHELQDDPALFFQTIYHIGLDRVGAAWVDAIRHRETFFCDFRVVRRDGAIVSVRESAVLIRDIDGNPIYWQGFYQDLTESKRAEDDLRASEERYRMFDPAGPRRGLRDGPRRRAADALRQPAGRSPIRLFPRGVAESARHLEI